MIMKIINFDFLIKELDNNLIEMVFVCIESWTLEVEQK